jgi:hypothetical protein
MIEAMRIPLWALLIWLGAVAPAAAQPVMTMDPFLGDIRGLRLGLSADAMPDGFAKFACGSNGGPPLQKLAAWSEFKTCRKDPLGLYEVAAEYDVVGQHLADMFVDMFREEAAEGGLWLRQYTGTKMAGHPVILSVLFDDAGIVQGVRAVTDSRAAVEERRVSNMLAVVVRNHFDPQNWTCETLPLENGQQPVGNSYIKQRCETVYRGERRMVVWRNFYRKPGQTGADRFGNVVEEWESNARWEMWSLSVKLN